MRTIFPEDYECARAQRTKLSAIAVDLAYVCDVVDSICRANSLSEGGANSLRRRAIEMMARAMEMAFEDRSDEAKELLGHLSQHVTTLRDSTNRMRYVVSNLFGLVCLLGAWAALRIVFPMNLTLTINEAVPVIHAVDVLALGAIGSFFAVSATVGSIRVNHSLSWGEMLYAGAVRVPIGLIGAGVVVLLISGGWLLGSIRAEYLPASYLLFGFLAGFSELFVPNTLKQVEATTKVQAPTNPGG